MKPWRGLVLGTLTAFLLSAPAADAVAATTASASAAATDERAARDAARAAKAAERAERQAARAAAKAERQRAIADAKAARAQEKAAPTAAPVHVAGVNAAAGDASADLVGNTAAHTETAESAAPTAESAAAAPLSDKEAARLDRRQMRAERKAEREAVKEERKAALAEARAEKRAAKAAERAEHADKSATKKRDRRSRYKTLFVDNGFTYYMDAQNTRWVKRPYNTEEYMIDAWVRLVENTTGEPVAEDGKIRPAKYFLEHYYISPARRQIMFMSELEVTGRPENTAKERTYDPRNWEQLVPGSIEDEIYEAITARMSSAPGQHGGILSGTSGMSLRDMIEEYARISF